MPTNMMQSIKKNTHLKRNKIKLQCYPDCIIYPICQSQTHITCYTLQRYFAHHYIKDHHESYAWGKILEHFPNLQSFSGGNLDRHTFYSRGDYDTL
jgi:hypothetical protein